MMKGLITMGYKSRKSRASTWGFVFAHLRRTPVKSALTMAVAIVAVLAMGYVGMLITNNEQKVADLYDSTVLSADLVSADNTALHLEGLIKGPTVTDLANSGYFLSACGQVHNRRSLWTRDGEQLLPSLIMRGIAQVEPMPFLWAGTTIDFGPGWDESCLTKDWNSSYEMMPIFLSEAMMAKTGASIGDSLLLAYAGSSWESINNPQALVAPVRVVLAGTYITNAEIDPTEDMKETAFFPLASTIYFGFRARYSEAEFVVDPAFNRTRDEIHTNLKATLTRNYDGPPLRLSIWDEEIRAVAEPMERTLSLLAVLYPVMTAAAVGIAAALAYLMVLQNARNAAILRVLGTGRRRALWMQLMEQWLPCIAGLVIGLAACILFLKMGTEGFLSSLLRAGLYFVGCAAGSIVAGISTTGRAPLDLLQVKE